MLPITVYTVFLAESGTPGSAGTKFLVGYMQNVLPRDAARPVPDAYLMISTNETGVVDFDVTTVIGGVERSTAYTVDSSAPNKSQFCS